MATSRVAAPTRGEVLQLYRSLLRVARQFCDYNIREYTKRRTIDGFRDIKKLTDPSQLSAAFSDGKAQLEIAKRQALVYSLYAPKFMSKKGGTSGVFHKEKKGFEGATSQGKLDQPVAEAKKGLGSEEQDKLNIGITEERKNEVEGEEKVKHARITTESEEAIKEKESAYCNEGQKTTGINANNKKAEEAIQNGSNGSDVGEVKP